MKVYILSKSTWDGVEDYSLVYKEYKQAEQELVKELLRTVCKSAGIVNLKTYELQGLDSFLAEIKLGLTKAKETKWTITDNLLTKSAMITYRDRSNPDTAISFRLRQVNVK